MRYCQRFLAGIPHPRADTHVFLTRPPLACLRKRVRLACVRHAASVYPEPGSNSPFSVYLQSLCRDGMTEVKQSNGTKSNLALLSIADSHVVSFDTKLTGSTMHYCNSLPLFSCSGASMLYAFVAFQILFVNAWQIIPLLMTSVKRFYKQFF